MAAIRATARRGRDSVAGGGAGRQRGRAGGRVDPLVGSHSAPARSGLARCEAVAGEGTGGADGRVEGGKRPSEVPVRAAAARVPSPSGCEALRRELNRADSHRQRGAATAASVRPPSASALPSWGPGFLSTPSSSSPQSLSSTLRKPRRLPGPLAGRMTELQSALLLRRQLAGERDGGRPGRDRGEPPRLTSSFLPGQRPYCRGGAAADGELGAGLGGWGARGAGPGRAQHFPSLRRVLGAGDAPQPQRWDWAWRPVERRGGCPLPHCWVGRCGGGAVVPSPDRPSPEGRVPGSGAAEATGPSGAERSALA